MEHIQKKAKITDHFRVILKPHHHDQHHNHNSNIGPKQQLASKKHLSTTNYNHIAPLKENVGVFGVSDDVKEDAKDIQGVAATKKTKKMKLVESQEDVTLVNKSNHQSANSKASALVVKVEAAPATKRDAIINRYITPPGLVKSRVVDHDRGLLHDICCEPHYALDSFNYDREQELKFRTRKYLVLSSSSNSSSSSNKMTPQMRARLVDWLVQIQDIYSLYHETLYLAVKICDQYLMKKPVEKNRLQLLYVTAIFMAAKFDERLSPLDLKDLLLYARQYTRKQVVDFEIELLKTLHFNLRFPLSYSFLRRFARCTGSDTRTLTLARYILESSMLDYEMIEVLESELAAASLLLAFKMLQRNDAWDDTAIYYTRYQEKDLQPTLMKLNEFMWQARNSSRATFIRNKYSHQIFMSVSSIEPLPESLLVNSTSGGDDNNIRANKRKFGKPIINLPSD